MPGYLFTTSTVRSQIRPTRIGAHTELRPQVWKTCDTINVYAGHLEQAQKLVEAAANQQPEGEHPQQIQILQIMSVPMQDQLLTETGNDPIDWPRLNKEFRAGLETQSLDVFEQGYWLDDSIVVSPGRELDAMRQACPEDVRAGLNWSCEKQFLFMISIFNLPATTAYDPETNLPTETAPMAPPRDEAKNYDFEAGLLEMDSVDADDKFLKLKERTTAVLIRARNAAVALWLWRNYSAKTKWAQNPIQL